jgi:hypothetical protein
MGVIILIRAIQNREGDPSQDGGGCYYKRRRRASKQIIITM